MNYYELLEIDRKASLDTIKKIYKIQIKRYHPDVYPENEKAEAEEKVKKITEAYEVLSNEEKRKEYDLKLKQEEKHKEDSKHEKDSYNENNASLEILMSQVKKYEEMLKKYANYIDSMNNIMENRTSDNYYQEVKYDYENENGQESISFKERMFLLKEKIKHMAISFLKITLVVGILILILLSIPTTREVIFSIINFFNKLYS